MRDITLDEINCVDGAAVSDDAIYTAALGFSVACVGAMLAVPTMGTSTTLVVWGASLVSSAVAYNVATN